jgi:hypothetical protein
VRRAAIFGLSVGLLPLAVAAAARAAWRPPQTIASSRLWQYERPRLALGASRAALVAWHREAVPGNRELNEETRLEAIEAATLAPAGAWSQPAVVSRPGVVFSPQVGIDGSGSALVAWEFGDPHSTFSTVAAASHRPGGSWTRPISLTGFALDGGQKPYLTVADNGAEAVVFTGETAACDACVHYARRGVELLHRLNAREHWRGPRTLAGNSNTLSEARVALDARGETILAWERNAQSFNSRWVQALVLGRDGKPRGPVQTLSSMTAASTDLQLAANSKGDAVLTWREYHLGREDRHTPVEVSTRLAGGRFSAAVILSRARNIEPTGAIDRNGDGCVLFTRILGAHPGPVEEFSPGRYGGMTAVEAATRPTRGRWSAPKPIVPVGTEFTSAPQIAADPASGSVIAIWIRHQIGTSIGRAEVSKGDGLGQWQQPAVLAEDAALPSVAAGQTGVALAAWVSAPPGDFSEIQASDYSPG